MSGQRRSSRRSRDRSSRMLEPLHEPGGRRPARGNAALQETLRERRAPEASPKPDTLLGGVDDLWGLGALGAEEARAPAPTRREERQASRDTARSERQGARAERKETREASQADRATRREDRQADRVDQRQERRTERATAQQPRQDRRADGREERQERREERRDDREERQQCRQLGRDGELAEHLSALDEEYAAHLDEAVQVGRAAFRADLEDLCTHTIVTGSLRRLARDQIALHADDAAEQQLQEAELDALADLDGAGEAEVEYTKLKLEAMLGGHRERQLDRKFEAELLENVLRRTALSTCSPFIDAQVADPALEAAVEDGAAVAYQRSLTYLESGGDETATAVGMTALATQLANPLLAPYAALAMVGTAVVDQLLGDPREAAVRAGEREAKQHFRRTAKKAVRRDGRFDRDGAFATQAAATVPTLVQDTGMQQQAFDGVMSEVTGQSMVDGFARMAGEWDAALDQSGQSVVADAGLESGLWVTGKLKVPVPIPGIHKVAYFFLDLGAKLTSETGKNMAVLLSVRGGLGAQLDLGSAVSAAIEAGLKITLSSSGADMGQVMQQLSYAFFRAFDSHMARAAQSGAAEMAQEPLVQCERRDGEDDAKATRRVIQERIVGGLWGMGGNSSVGAYDEAQAWARMVEEQMIASGGKASFTAGVDLHGDLKVKLGGKKDPPKNEQTKTLKSNGLKWDNKGLQAVVPDEVKISTDVGSHYVGTLSAGEDGGVDYTDKMQEYVILKGSFGPISAYVKFFFDQGLGKDDPDGVGKCGLLQYGLTLTMPTNEASTLARILADGPGGIVAPLEFLMDQLKGRQDTPLSGAGAADTSQQGDPCGDLRELVDEDVQRLIVNTGVDDNLEGIAQLLSQLGELQIQLVGQKVLYGSPDGLDYGGGWDNSLILRSMLDVNLEDETKTEGTADRVMEVDFKAWSEHAELILSQQSRA